MSIFRKLRRHLQTRPKQAKGPARYINPEQQMHEAMAWKSPKRDKATGIKKRENAADHFMIATQS